MSGETIISSLKFFYVGMWVMRKMRFATKLALMAAVVLVPMLVVLTQLLSRQNQELRITRSEIAGIRLVSDAGELIRQLQSHRGQTNMVLSGNTAAQAARDKTREAVRQSRDALDGNLQSAKAEVNSVEWGPLRARIDGLVPALEGKDAATSFALHTELIEDLNRYVYGLGKESGLLFDPDPATYLLMDMVVSRTIPWTEQLGKLRGQGAGLLSKPELDEGGAVRVRTQLDALDALGRDLQYAVKQMTDFGVSDPLADKAIQASAAFSRMARERFAAGAATGDPQAYFALGSQTIEAVTVYQRSAVDGVVHLLQGRLEGARRMFWLTAVGSATGVLVMLYLMLSFEISFLSDLRQVLQFMEQTASGNLLHKVRVQGRDELADMSTAMSSMVHNFSSMVASVRSNAALVSHAGSSLVEGNRSLSDRTEQQAANLEQTSASVQELSSMVQENAQAAQASDATARQVRDVAEKGAQSMAQAIESVEAIQSSTRRMDEIVGVIDGLAFQTNILALNAAVEAARAGESGRGFAVVASEVRSLAQRSAGSAKEIRQLISTSSAQVAVGVTQIRTAGANLTEIVDGIREVAAKMSQISAFSGEQSASLTEITAAVRQLDTITQQNAAMVETAVEQATDLGTRASTLAESVAVFQLQQGTADEARALVDRAAAYRHKCASRETYIRELTAAANHFFDRDMYVFLLDDRGTYLAFGGNPAKVGTLVQDIAGIDGQGLVDAIISKARAGSGWVEYDINNPLTGKVQTKMSFVQMQDDMYLGCGVYKHLVVS